MFQPKPEWLKIKAKPTENLEAVKDMLAHLGLSTVCEEAACPNLTECFGKKTATFMILGRQCTRNCTFCNVTQATPTPVDPDEPRRVAEAVKQLGLKHVVLTSVTRDDLPDGGASHFAEVLEAIRILMPETVTEVLIPDFQGDEKALQTVLEAKPIVLNHNIETVPRLYSTVRPMADYAQSLELIARAKRAGAKYTKSGIMVGLGETAEEVTQTLRDLRDHNCELLTIGQYLAPSKKHHPVVQYIPPEQFDRYAAIAMQLGFLHVASAPFVRSSYMAEQAVLEREFKV